MDKILDYDKTIEQLLCLLYEYSKENKELKEKNCGNSDGCWFCNSEIGEEEALCTDYDCSNIVLKGNTLEYTYEDDAEIFDTFEIERCPICGRILN